MTRKEYMKKLDEALSVLPEKTREAAILFCEEMLDDRMEDGMDEEAAVAAMESPETIALRLGAENGEPIDMGNLKLPNREDYLEFARLSDTALEGVEKALNNAEHQETEQAAEPSAPLQQEAPRTEQRPLENDWGSSISRIVQSALESARQGIEMGQQAMEDNGDRRAPEEAEQKVLTCDVSALRGIRLNCSNTPIQVRPCPGSTVTLTYYTSPEDPYEATVQNGVLSLERLGRGKAGVKFGIFGLRMLLNHTQPVVELLLPADALVDLSMHTANGSIRVGGFDSLCAIDAHTSNSRIEMRNITCKSMELKSSNARLVMENVVAKQNLTAVTSNARIEVDHIRSGDDVTLKTSNGALNLRAAIAGGTLNAATSNGHILSEGLAGAALTLKSSNGSIRGTVSGRPEDYAIDSYTSNGRNTLRSGGSGKLLYVHTSNGSIDVGFEG